MVVVNDDAPQFAAPAGGFAADDRAGLYEYPMADNTVAGVLMTIAHGEAATSIVIAR